MRTPLFTTLRRAVKTAIYLHKNNNGIPFDEHIALLQHQQAQYDAEQRQLKLKQKHLNQQYDALHNKPNFLNTAFDATANPIRSYSRRHFLSQSSKAALALGIGSLLSTACRTTKSGQTAPRIAIIGAGMAGLNTAYYLKKMGINSTIYEASNRSGGRMFSKKNLLGNDLTTEVGGEFIDSWHSDMLQLAQEFNLPLFDSIEDITNDKLQAEMFIVNGQQYNERNAVAQLLTIAPKLINHINELPETINYQSLGKVKAFDNISIEEYFTKIGMNDWLKVLFNTTFTGEYGLEMSEQSALNFLTLFNPSLENGKFALFGDSDERYKIKGGNQQIIDQISQKIEPQIKYEHALNAIKQGNSNTFVLSFANNKVIDADIVVLAIPFTILRHIDLQLPIPNIKQRAIQNLGYGTNSKLFIGTQSRLWREQGHAGFLYSNQIHTGWDNTQGQTNNKGNGGYTVFLGGQAGYNLAKEKANEFNATLDLAYPGFSQQLNGKVEAFNWAKHPHSKGSYSCYKIGQWTSISGIEALPVGNLLFAGEHCSTTSAGFMNGAAESGRTTAEYIAGMLNNII